MTTIVLVKRRNGEDDEVLLNGEIAYNVHEKEFYVGDGNTPINKLTPFNSLVAGDDGKIYTVRVDKDGNAHAKPVVCFNKGVKLEFKVKN